MTQIGLRVGLMGGMGFIGRHLATALVRTQAEVRIYGRLPSMAGRLHPSLPGNVDVIAGSIEDTDRLLDFLKGIDVGVHLACNTVPATSMKEPVADVRDNVVPNASWLSRIGETSLRRVLFISSGGTVYGEPRFLPVNEDHPTNPISSYGITRLAVEKYVALYSELAGTEAIVCRPSNVYGEGQRVDRPQGVISVFLDRLIRGETIQIWGDGTEVRDYLYVGDTVDALLRLIHVRAPPRIVNIASGKGYSVNQVVEIISKVTGTRVEAVHVPARAYHVPENVLDNRLLRSTTGWKPLVSLEEGIARVWRWKRRMAGAPERATHRT